MLLTRLVRYTKRLRDDDQGVALVAVMALMLVGMLLSSLIAASVIGGISSTTATRAGVQSEASAQSGAAVALASLETGSCSPTYTSNVSPVYTATVSYATQPTLASAVWIAGCPTLSAQFMKIVSTGKAASTGVGGNTTGNTSKIETIYNRPVTTVTIQTTGPAVYTYSATGFGGSGTLVSSDGTPDANVLVRSGNVNCSGGGGISGDLVVNGGNLTMSGSCNVAGSVWATGDVNVGNNNIGGDLESATATVGSGTVSGNVWTTGLFTSGGVLKGNAYTGGITISSNDAIWGDVYSTAGVSQTWGGNVGTATSGGNIYAKSFTFNGGNITKGANVAGTATLNASYTGYLKTQVKAGGGTATTTTIINPLTLPAQPAPNPIPTVPSWINFAYNQSDWTGFGYYKLTAAQCNDTGLVTAITAFGGGKGVVDGSSCTGQIVFSSSTVINLANDVALILPNGWGFNNDSFASTTSTPHNLWVIRPDSTVESPATPTCPSGATDTLAGGFKMTNIVMMMYDPCTVSISSGIQFTGQVFAGKTSIDGAAHLTYTKVGLPGFNLDTGTSSTTTTAPNTWIVVSNRDIAG